MTDVADQKLLPCPFCGCDPGPQEHADLGWVVCGHCAAEGPGMGDKPGSVLWNARVALACPWVERPDSEGCWRFQRVGLSWQDCLVAPDLNRVYTLSGEASLKVLLAMGYTRWQKAVARD